MTFSPSFLNFSSFIKVPSNFKYASWVLSMDKINFEYFIIFVICCKVAWDLSKFFENNSWICPELLV